MSEIFDFDYAEDAIEKLMDADLKSAFTEMLDVMKLIAAEFEGIEFEDMAQVEEEAPGE